MRQSDRGRRSLLSGVGVALAALLVSCGGCQYRSPISNESVGGVAKRWMLAIRENQLTPLYPPSNSVQPGTVLLSKWTVDQQLREASKSGFLEIDLEFDRIDPPSQPKPEPRAVAFPSFTFDLHDDSHVKIGLPIQSLAFAASFAHDRDAKIQVKIDDASTSSIPVSHILGQVTKWQGEHQAMLERLGRRVDQSNYIRIISQVFLAKRLTVTISSSRGFDMGAGVEPIIADDGTKTTTGLASAKVIYRDSHSIVLSETFSESIVFGYRGIDFAILKTGALGPPVVFSNDDDLSLGRYHELAGLLYYLDGMEEPLRRSVIQAVLGDLSRTARAIYTSDSLAKKELTLTFQKWLGQFLPDEVTLKSNDVARLFVACYVHMAGDRFVFATSDKTATVEFDQIPPHAFLVRAAYVNERIQAAIDNAEMQHRAEAPAAPGGDRPAD